VIRTMRIATVMSVALLTSSINAAEPLKLDNDTARLNYSLGYQVGGDFKRQGVKMDAEAIIKGIEDALSGTEPMMSPPEMHATLTELKRKVVADERTKLRKGRAETELQYLAEGKKFMEENATKPGVKTTASGLQYKIIEAGKGKTPGPADQVTVNYRGTQTNGNEFDSSYKRGKPASFQLNGVIKGWTEGLQLIKEGGKIQLFIPPELAYAGRGPMAHRTLIFDVELISVGGGKQSGSVQRDTDQEKN
jgi:FKBP-type peptidyl-prolyl cis-trans isomerase FklB